MIFERVGGFGGVLNQGGVLPSGVVDLSYGLIHPFDAGRLVGRSLRNFTDYRTHTADGSNDVAHRPARRLDQGGAGIDGVDRRVDQRADLARGVGAAAGEAAHFGRNHGESAAMVSRARRLNGGVEGQDIRLECETVDDADDVGDLAGCRGDFIHRPYDLRYGRAAIAGNFGGVRRESIGRMSLFAGTANDLGDFGHRTRRRLHARRLLLAAGAELGIAAGHFTGRRIDGLGGALDLSDHLLEPVRGAVGVVLQLAERAPVVSLDALRQISLRQRFEHARDIIEAGLGGGEQTVDARYECAMKPRVGCARDAVRQRDAPIEFAERGGVDDGRHFALQGGLFGLVAPFEHETDFPAIVGPYHIARYPKCPRPDPQVRPPSVGYGREAVGREAGESDAVERISGAGK